MRFQIAVLLIVAFTTEALAYGRRRQNRRPANRQSTTDPWPANGRTTRPTNRRTTADPWPADTTTRRPTTTQGPIGRNFCQTEISTGDCTSFYTCLLEGFPVCDPDDVPALELLVNICLESENAQDDNQFGNNAGNRYIAEYRKCTQQRILEVADSNSCDDIDSKANEILITEDLIWDCLYQNHTLCDVVQDGDNSEALGIIFAGMDRISFQVYQFLMKRVEAQCGSRTGRQFAKDFGQTFLSNMQSKIMMSGNMMMMMGGNGGD